MATLAELVLSLKGDTAHLVRSLDVAEARTGKFGKNSGASLSKWAGIAGAAMLAGGVAIAAGAVIAVNAAGDVEQQLDVLQEVSGATRSEMQRLGEEAKVLGGDLTLPGTSSKDAAEAMTELAKAGLSVNDTLKASKGVLQLSAAGQLSNAKAAEVTANALNAFRLKGGEAVRVADLLAAAANASSVEVAHVGDSLQMSAAVFSAANVPIEDLVASIALLGNAGIKGSDAGTSLKQSLLALQSPSEKAAGIMKDIGFSAYDASGTMKDWRDIIENLASSTAGMTQQQRDFALSTIFGSDAVRAINVLLAEGTEGYDAMAAAVEREGAAADLAAARNKGWKGVLDGMKSTIETLTISAGTLLLPMFTKAGEFANEALAQIEPLAQLFARGFGGGQAGAADDLSGFESAVFTAGQKAGEFLDIVEDIAPEMDTLRGIGSDFIDGVKTGFETVRDVATEVRDRAQEILDLAEQGDWEGAGALVAEGLLAGLEQVRDLGARLVAMVMEQIEGVDWGALGRDAFHIAVPFIAGFLMALLDPVEWVKVMAANWELTLAVLITIIASPAKWIASVTKALAKIPLVGKILGWLVNAIHDGGRQAVGPILRGLGTLAKDLFDGFLGALGKSGAGVAPKFRGIISGGVNAIGEFAGAIGGKARMLMYELGDWLGRHGPKQALTGLRKIGGAIDDAASGFVTKMKDVGKQMIGGLVEGIKDAPGKVKDAVIDVGEDAVNGVKGFLRIQSPSRVFADIGEQMMAGLGMGIEGGGAVSLNALREHAKQLEAQARSIRLEAGLTALQGGNTDALDAALGRVNDQLTLLRDVMDPLEVAIADVEDAAARMTDALGQIQQDFLNDQIQAYLDGGQEAVDVVRAQQAQMRTDAELLAEDLHRTFGIDLPDALGIAMARMREQAEEVAAAAARGREMVKDALQSNRESAKEKYGDRGVGFNVGVDGIGIGGIAGSLAKAQESVIRAATRAGREDAIPELIKQLTGQLPNFGGGGDVPGPFGAARLVVAHAGERVLTAQQQREHGGGQTLVVNQHFNIAGSIQAERDLKKLAAEGVKESLRGGGFRGLIRAE